MSAIPKFTLTLRVAEADIDRQGHVNNVAFVRYIQEIAIAHWRTLPPRTCKRPSPGWCGGTKWTISVRRFWVKNYFCERGWASRPAQRGNASRKYSVQVKTCQWEIATCRPQSRASRPLQWEIATCRPQSRASRPLQWEIATCRPQSRASRPLQLGDRDLSPAKPGSHGRSNGRSRPVARKAGLSRPLQWEIATCRPQSRASRPLQLEIATCRSEALRSDGRSNGRSRPVARKAGLHGRSNVEIATCR